MTVYGPQTGRTGSSSRPIAVSGGAHIFNRSYYRSASASGDVRAHYEDLDFTSTGSGEVFRIRAIANGTGVATGGTVNAIHATGRVAAAKTVSGALNAIRATLEVAGTNPTPGGTLSALRVDSNLVTGITVGANDAFIAVGNVGAGKLQNLFVIDDAIATKSDTALVTTTHADHAYTHGIKIRVNGTNMWLMACTDSQAS